MNTQVVRQKYGRSKFRVTAVPRRQRGIVVVLSALAMLVLLGFAAMSLDGGHMLLNNTRLQDVVDAATLNAAKTLDAGGTTAEADAAVFLLLNANASDIGYEEIDAALQGGIIPVIEYSAMVVPFVDGTVPARFVRVTVTNLPLQPWFMQMFGLAKGVSVSAVSGPSNALTNTVCDIFPLVACGCDPLVDPTGCPGDFYGYDKDEIEALKIAAGDKTEIGPGNFQLLRLPGGQGGAFLRENVAGGYEGCLNADEPAETEPGNVVGPLSQGINLRFGQATGPLDPDIYQADFVTDYPTPGLLYDGVDEFGNPKIKWNGDSVTQASDLIDDSGNYSYGGDYSADYAENAGIYSLTEYAGQYERRILTVPIGDCSGTINGQGSIDLYGFGCFFLIQPVSQQGGESWVFGEFIKECNSFGTFDETPVEGGPTKIVLYKDPAREDS